MGSLSTNLVKKGISCEYVKSNPTIVLFIGSLPMLILLVKGRSESFNAVAPKLKFSLNL